MIFRHTFWRVVDEKKTRVIADGEDTRVFMARYRLAAESGGRAH